MNRPVCLTGPHGNFIRGCRKRDCGTRSQGTQSLAFELNEPTALSTVHWVLI